MTHADLIAAMKLRLDSEPTDSLTRLALADLYEERGEWLLALLQRFLVTHELAPQFSTGRNQEHGHERPAWRWEEEYGLGLEWYDNKVPGAILAAMPHDLTWQRLERSRFYSARIEAEAALFAALISQGWLQGQELLKPCPTGPP